MICTALLSAATLFGGPVDSEVAPYAYVATTRVGSAYFKMRPDPEEKYDRDKGSGTVYFVKAVGADEPQWSVKGWYAYDVFLADDAEHVIRMGNWPEGQEPEQADLAVAFYRKDRLLASYSTADLILDRSKVRPSVSHYRYLEGRPDFDRREMQLTLVSIDRVQWIFDVTTGKVLSQKQLLPE